MQIRNTLTIGLAAALVSGAAIPAEPSPSWDCRGEEGVGFIQKPRSGWEIAEFVDGPKQTYRIKMAKMPDDKEPRYYVYWRENTFPHFECKKILEDELILMKGTLTCLDAGKGEHGSIFQFNARSLRFVVGMDTVTLTSPEFEQGKGSWYIGRCTRA